MNDKSPLLATEPTKRRKRAPAAKKEKRPISEVEAQGPGPWKVFMMVNVGSSDDSKKQTEIRIDTYPDLLKETKNQMDQGDWTIIMTLGDFYRMDDAATVLAEWTDETRGQGSRIAQGLVLWQKYKDRGIQLTVSDQSKKEIQSVFNERRKLAGQPAQQIFEDGSGPLSTHKAPGTVTIREILEIVFPGEMAPKKRGGGRGRKKKIQKQVEEDDEDEENEE